MAVWHRTAPTNARRVSILCAAFAALIAGGLYRVWQPAEMPVTLVMPESVDPVARFNQTRVGHLLFAQAGGSNCRRVLFDNKTGALQDAGELYCGAPLPEAAESANRMLALRKAFQK